MKNEEKVLKRMLDSVMPIIDGAVVCDTGSTDKSKEIVQQVFKDANKPVEIFDFEYKNDKEKTELNFAAWRNKALRHLKGRADFGLWIDCSNIVIFKENFNLKDFKIKLNSTDIGGIQAQGDGSIFSRRHLFRISKPLKWNHKVHEVLYCLEPHNYLEFNDFHIICTTDGSSWKSQATKEKYLKFAKTLKEEVIKNNTDTRSMFYLAQSYLAAKEYEEALKWYKKRAARQDGFFEERYVSKFRSAYLMNQLNYPKRDVLLEYQKCSELDEMRVEHLLEIMYLLHNERRYDEAYEISKIGMEKYHQKNPYPKRVLFINPNAYSNQLFRCHLFNCTQLDKYDEIQHLVSLPENQEFFPLLPVLSEPYPIEVNENNLDSINVIWQTANGEVTGFELEYIQRVLLSKIDYIPHFDNESFQTVKNNSLIIYSNDQEDISQEFRNYLKKFDELKFNYSLLHLSNENLNHNYDYYRNAKHVWRGYYDDSVATDKELKNRVSFIPIGFKSGFYNSDYNSLSDASRRPFIWSFIGQLKLEREEMCNALKEIIPNYQHHTAGWNDPNWKSPKQVAEIYKQTIFAPCPRGWGMTDAGGFRLLETLEWGCIPVIKVEENNSTLNLYQEIFPNHSFIEVKTWKDAGEKIIELLKTPGEINRKQKEIASWYLNYKAKLADSFTILKEIQNKKKVSVPIVRDNNTLCIVIPFRNRDEHLDQFIPHMKNFLLKKKISFKIVVVEQADSKPFNRGKLLNIGFKETMGQHGNYCFHDVDMLPLENADYSFVSTPTHLASMVEQFFWNLPYIDKVGRFYTEYFGGVTLYDAISFEKVNGFSNDYWGWGCEDDDLRNRTAERGIKIDRRKCMFRSLHHTPNNNGSDAYSKNLEKYNSLFRNGKFIGGGERDGLSKIQYISKETTNYEAYTRIKVEL